MHEMTRGPLAASAVVVIGETDPACRKKTVGPVLSVVIGNTVVHAICTIIETATAAAK
jgi:hypothetical protein